LLAYPRIDVDEEIARRSGELLAAADDAVGGSSGVGANDAYIAAVADVFDDTVLTDNVTDFQRLGVSVESY
jgi:predicted nucleic acid-binding protein